jgi:WD40 repeat protein
VNVATLRLLGAGPGERHEGEVFACSYAADGGFVLSGGWDGHLRLWDASTGSHLAALKVGPKPLSACAFTPDGRHWLAGSMEGFLSVHDAVSHQTLLSFIAHTRPISAISFAPDGKGLATASWDRQIGMRKVGAEREGRTLSGHQDIVAGCRHLDERLLISWSHDRTLRLWDLDLAREVGVLRGHADRVTAAAVSPDGRLAVSGSRDGTVRLWDLSQQAQVDAAELGGELRACFFLLDGESVVLADGAGQMLLARVPGFEVVDRLATPVKVMCGDLAPSGMQIALGGEDGQVHFVAVEGLEEASLVVTATASLKSSTGILGRLIGKSKVKRTYQYTCPVCRQDLESATLPQRPVSCPGCRRTLRVSAREGLPAGS